MIGLIYWLSLSAINWHILHIVIIVISTTSLTKNNRGVTRGWAGLLVNKGIFHCSASSPLSPWAQLTFKYQIFFTAKLDVSNEALHITQGTQNFPTWITFTPEQSQSIPAPLRKTNHFCPLSSPVLSLPGYFQSHNLSFYAIMRFQINIKPRNN